jgi:hypothetical protein
MIWDDLCFGSGSEVRESMLSFWLGCWPTIVVLAVMMWDDRIIHVLVLGMRVEDFIEILFLHGGCCIKDIIAMVEDLLFGSGYDMG